MVLATSLSDSDLFGTEAVTLKAEIKDRDVLLLVNKTLNFKYLASYYPTTKVE